MQCEHCGSEDLSYERDALLVATPLRIDGEVLVLDSAPRPDLLDEVRVSCRQCGEEQSQLRWDDWRPEHAPPEQHVVEAEEALDLIVRYINEPGECQGADFLEFVSQLLPRTGREIIDS